MNDPHRLSPDELVPHRPFTDPGHLRRDLEILRYMRAALRSVVAAPEAVGAAGQTTIGLREPDGRAQTVTIARRDALLAGVEFWIVGFFGHRREGVDQAPMQAADAALIVEFAEHPGILSYSRLQLESGDWANMVVLAGAEASHHWLSSQRHVYAVRQLAPAYYHTVRLHNAHLAGALASSAEITLVRTRYYDYAGTLPWIAVRDHV